MNCPKCGAEIDENSQFCSKCGYKIEDSSVKKNAEKENKKSDSFSISKKRLSIVVIIIIVIVAIFGIYTYISNQQLQQTGQTTSLTGGTEFQVYAFSPKTTESEVQTMSSDSDFYNNNETKEWLDGLDNYVMLSTDSAYLVMERSEADKLPVNDTYDSHNYPYNVITCDVVETHSLGTGLKDCILVKNVEFVSSGVKHVD